MQKYKLKSLNTFIVHSKVTPCLYAHSFPQTHEIAVEQESTLRNRFITNDEEMLIKHSQSAAIEQNLPIRNLKLITQYQQEKACILKSNTNVNKNPQLHINPQLTLELCHLVGKFPLSTSCKYLSC